MNFEHNKHMYNNEHGLKNEYVNNGDPSVFGYQHDQHQISTKRPRPRRRERSNYRPRYRPPKFIRDKELNFTNGNTIWQPPKCDDLQKSDFKKWNQKDGRLESYCPVQRKPIIKPFQEIVRDSKWISIVVDGYPYKKLTLDQVKNLKGDLLTEIDKAVACGDFIPRFFGNDIIQGTLRLVCADPESEDWVNRTVKKISPWQGAHLQVLRGEFLSRFQNVLVKFVGVDVETDLILQKLAQKEQGLLSNLWRVYNRCREGNTTYLALGIDTSSLIDLDRKLNYRVDLEIGKVLFEVEARN